MRPIDTLHDSLLIVRESFDAVAAELAKYQRIIRKIRDMRGDDRCWKDYEELFALLPEGYTPPARDETLEIELCRLYIRACHDPKVQYVSPQRRIEELEAHVKTLENLLNGATSPVRPPDPDPALVRKIEEACRAEVAKFVRQTPDRMFVMDAEKRIVQIVADDIERGRS